MKVTHFDHIVVRVKDVQTSLRFYTEALGLQPERVEEYRTGNAPFPSVRISEESIIDIVQAMRSDGSENVDHFCLMIEEADMAGLASKLRSQGVEIQQDVVRRWGAQG